MLESLYDKIEEEEATTTKNEVKQNGKKKEYIYIQNHTLIVGSHTLHVLRHIV